MAFGGCVRKVCLPFPYDQAWDYIEHCGHPSRFLITDLQIPGKMDGVRIVQKVRQSSTNIPIVVATGYHNGINSLKRYEVYWLQKPFNFDQLIGACMELAPITQDTVILILSTALAHAPPPQAIQ